MLRSTIFNSFFLLCLLSLLTSCSTTKKITKQVESSINSEVFNQSFSGFALYDPEKKEFIVEKNSNKYYTPASNIKLLTFYAGLKELKDSIPGIKYIIHGDSLIFWGTGDPSFLNPNLPKSKVYEFLKSTTKDLYFTNSEETITPLGSGWAWDDYNDDYSAEKSEFPIYGNLANFRWDLEDSIPNSNPSHFNLSLKKGKKGSKSIHRDVDQNIFRHPSYNQKENKEVSIPFKTSSELIIKLLGDTLNKPVKLITFPMSKRAEAQVLYSNSTDSLYKEMLHESDNFIAEQLLLLISEKLSDTLSTDIAIKHLQKTFFQQLKDEIKWVDGSGLSRYNLATPRTLVEVLELIYQEVSKERLFQLLPAAGKSGTLKSWQQSEEPYLFAKSGSLRNNYSLSGFLKTNSGKTLIFSFMNNNFVIPSSEIKQEMQKILFSIHKSY